MLQTINTEVQYKYHLIQTHLRWQTEANVV